VAQGIDNKYYLKHSFQKKKSGHACIFLDWRNEPGDLNYVVYGHDMRDRTFFGSLQDYHD
jgi:sortase B